MNLFRFCLWTSVGAGLWVSILTLTGYWLGDKALQLWDQHKTTITIGLIALAVLLGLVFVMSKLLWKKTPASDVPTA